VWWPIIGNINIFSAIVSKNKYDTPSVVANYFVGSFVSTSIKRTLILSQVWIGSLIYEIYILDLQQNSRFVILDL